MLERFGTTGVPQGADTLAKRRATNVARYGGAAPQASAAVREKTKRTLQARYGVDNVSSLPTVRAKASATMVTRLGVPFAMMAPTVQAKSEATCIERYGVKHNTQAAGMKQKSVATRVEKYGVEWPGQSPEIQSKIEATNRTRYGVKAPTQNQDVLSKSLRTKLDHYGTLSPAVFGKCENALADDLESWGLSVRRQHVMKNNKSIDVLVPTLNMGVEYCGLYWHNEYSPEPRDHRYHAGKAETAAAEGIRLITIFEDEWLQRRAQVTNVLKAIFGLSSRRLGARQCRLHDLEVPVAKAFLEAHHLQGAAPHVRYAVGLSHGDELVGVMTLGPHHRQGQGALVLNRLGFAADTSVAGGASRLFKAACAWARAQGHQTIISWSDNRWFAGGVYPQLGFRLAEELPPDYTYVVRKAPRERLSKQSQKKDRVDCPPGLTEHEWARQRGLARVWDCGHKRWEFTL